MTQEEIKIQLVLGTLQVRDLGDDHYSVITDKELLKLIAVKWSKCMHSFYAVIAVHTLYIRAQELGIEEEIREIIFIGG